jgi:hypothetical protein
MVCRLPKYNYGDRIKHWGVGGGGQDVARADDEIHVYGVLWETPNERTPVDDLVRWEDNTETYLKVRQ